MSVVKENNCFAYRENELLPGRGECFALTQKQPYCGTVKCPFYKPKSQYVRHEKDGKVYFTNINGNIVQEE